MSVGFLYRDVSKHPCLLTEVNVSKNGISLLEKLISNLMVSCIEFI